MMMASRTTLLTSILNCRDVAESINHASQTDRLRTGLLWRAATPDHASVDDRRRLKDELGVKTIVDLRTTTEHVENARKRSERQRIAAAATNSTIEGEPLQIPDIAYRNINFNGKNYTDSLLKQLSWPQYIKLIALIISGYRMQGIRVLGENVMKHRGLSGLAVDSIDACTAEVRQIFEVLADEDSYPVLIHCTHGKDRTGLVVMLALLVCGADIDSIKTDYMLSESELEPEREERIREIQSIGLTEEFAACDPGFVSAVYQHIMTQYGSVSEYLSGACGVTEDMQGSVRRILLQQREASSV